MPISLRLLLGRLAHCQVVSVVVGSCELSHLLLGGQLAEPGQRVVSQLAVGVRLHATLIIVVDDRLAGHVRTQRGLHHRSEVLLLGPLVRRHGERLHEPGLR